MSCSAHFIILQGEELYYDPNNPCCPKCKPTESKYCNLQMVYVPLFTYLV